MNKPFEEEVTTEKKQKSVGINIGFDFNEVSKEIERMIKEMKFEIDPFVHMAEVKIRK